MARVASNIAANFVGRAWTMLLGLAFVPVYLKFLGIEAYGLIGLFLTLQSVLGILDLGLSLSLNRELARISGRARELRLAANLLRTLEIIYWFISISAGILVIASASWIATSLVNPTTVSVESVENAVRMMGGVIALQAPFSLYQGGLTGLQQQVKVNLILAVSATFRAVGAVLILWLLSPTIEAYFAWQVITAALTTAACGWSLWLLVEGRGEGAHFDPSLLRGLWRFALAVSANAIVGISLTQLDKLILIKLLTLEQFGYYMLATLVASFLWAIILPINTALFPRFVQLHDQGDDAALATLYHKACLFMAAALLPVTLMLTLFSYELLLLWTGEKTIAQNTHVLVSLLALGTTLNGLTSVAGYLQNAAGWPGLILRTNTSLALILVPTLLIAVPLFGAVGAASVWVAINSAYLFYTVPAMHRRLLRGEIVRWYFADLLLPIISVLLVGLPARVLMPQGWPPLLELAFLGCVWAASVIAVILVAPNLRCDIANFVLRFSEKMTRATRIGMRGE